MSIELLATRVSMKTPFVVAALGGCIVGAASSEHVIAASVEASCPCLACPFLLRIVYYIVLVY
jgi:hypothetical protein